MNKQKKGKFKLKNESKTLKSYCLHTLVASFPCFDCKLIFLTEFVRFITALMSISQHKTRNQNFIFT